MSFLKELFLLLRTVTGFRLRNKVGWVGVGKVSTHFKGETKATVFENGFWEEQKIAFSNTFRWTLNLEAGKISLEHLRFGPENPVFLCDLVSGGEGRLISEKPHCCSKDVYTATLFRKERGFVLSWRVTGPKKDDEFEREYFLP